jgi:hypothetical protein
MAYNPNKLRPLNPEATRVWGYFNADGDNVFVPGFITDGVQQGMSDFDFILVQTPNPNSNHPNAGVTGTHSIVAIDKAVGTATIGW